MSLHALLEEKRRDIERLCEELSVRRLDVFGSAVTGGFDVASSDVDVLVEFDLGPGADYFTAYFELKEGLERILGRPVDVITSAGLRNPYFRENVVRTREVLYAA